MIDDRPAEVCACGEPLGPDLRCPACDEAIANWQPSARAERPLADNPSWPQPEDPFAFPSF